MRNCFADQTRRVVHQLYLTTETRRSTALAFRRWQAFPVQNHIPQHPVIGMIQIAMHRIEIESDHTSAARWKIKDRSVSFEIISAFHSAADHHFGLFFFLFFFLSSSSISRSYFGRRVPPLHHNPASISRTHSVSMIRLAKNRSCFRITICNRMILSKNFVPISTPGDVASPPRRTLRTSPPSNGSADPFPKRHQQTAFAPKTVRDSPCLSNRFPR